MTDDGVDGTLTELMQLVAWMDHHIDTWASSKYRDEPLAQDWARVAKAGEEVGEAIDALIGMTGQNFRKGHYGSLDCLLNELADVALTGLYAIQHFTKYQDDTREVLMNRARFHQERAREVEL